MESGTRPSKIGFHLKAPSSAERWFTSTNTLQKRSQKELSQLKTSYLSTTCGSAGVLPESLDAGVSASFFVFSGCWSLLDPAQFPIALVLRFLMCRNRLSVCMQCSRAFSVWQQDPPTFSCKRGGASNWGIPHFSGAILKNNCCFIRALEKSQLS